MQTYAADGGEALRIDDGVLGPEMRGDVLLELQMDIEGAVEAWSRTGADTMRAYCLDCRLDEPLVSGQVMVIVVGELGDFSAIAELRFAA